MDSSSRSGEFGREGEAPAEPKRLPVRKRPAHGVDLEAAGPTVVFVTVCTKARRKCLADSNTHSLLRSVWCGATHWLVGRYVVMPDHIHLFAAPNDDRTELDAWVRYWKSMFTRAVSIPEFRWQSNHWDTRMRGSAVYQAKWEYVRANPVRHGLVEDEADWPFQGEIHEF